MNKSGYLYGITFLFLIAHLNNYAQVPTRQFNERVYDSIKYSEFKAHKKIPDEIMFQVLTALSFYPELKDTKIIFRHRKRKTPLSSRPRSWSLFKKKKKRTYLITISTKSDLKLSPILFFNLPYNAQIGVVGHELGHILEYRNKNTWQMLGLSLKLFNSEYVDKFEFNTDRICIDHGLGYQLYDWSNYVRKVLDIPEWRGASEVNYDKKANTRKQRYMNPLTINKYIALNSLYQNVK